MRKLEKNFVVCKLSRISEFNDGAWASLSGTAGLEGTADCRAVVLDRKLGDSLAVLGSTLAVAERDSRPPAGTDNKLAVAAIAAGSDRTLVAGSCWVLAVG